MLIPDYQIIPIEGQLWYDTTTNRLQINDSTAGVALTETRRWRSKYNRILIPIKGDVWVDTTNNPLYIYTATHPVLVGPNFSGGLKAGVPAEQVVDTAGVQHTIIKNYVDDRVVTIISKDSLIPKQVIEGFVNYIPVLIFVKGISMLTVLFKQTSATATKADALNVTQPAVEIVNANNFLRSDITDTMNGPLYVRNDGGVTIVPTQIFNLEIASNNATTPKITV